MNICSRHHEEVVFENHACPVCELIKTHDEKVTELEGQIDELKYEVRQLEQSHT